MKTKVISIKDATRLKECVMTYGHFSTIHPGHIRYLRNARKYGKIIVVALMGDNAADSNNNRFEFAATDRAETLALMGIADIIVILNGDELTEAINVVNPGVLVLGTEMKTDRRVADAIDVVSGYGGNVRFSSGENIYANTVLLGDSESSLKKRRVEEYIRTCTRAGVSRERLNRYMEEWGDTRLIVLGDSVVDQYAACEAVGMSAEAPVIVVRERESRNFVGAAGVVASHIRALGASCEYISVIGDDETGKFIEEELTAQGIGCWLSRDTSRPTTLKKRYIVDNQKLFRVSKLEDHRLDEDVEAEVIERVRDLAPKADGIVISDFVYGVVTDRVLKEVTKVAKEYGLYLFGDVQCSSQVGEITRFENFSLLCPNEKELRYAMRDKTSGIEVLCQSLLSRSNTKRLIVKLAGEGFIAYEREDGGKVNRLAFPALSVNPVDVTGAGDSVLAVMATGIASGQPIIEVAALACVMASLSVETMGNIPIGIDKLRMVTGEYLRETPDRQKENNIYS